MGSLFTSLRAILMAGLLAAPLTATADVVLIMAEEDGCYWCERWHEEIAEIYPKSAEGRAAPLQRYDLYSGSPEGVAFTQPVRFTPTFILTVDGDEVGRIEGYPGEDFFWGLLGLILERAGTPLEEMG